MGEHVGCLNVPRMEERSAVPTVGYVTSLLPESDPGGVSLGGWVLRGLGLATKAFSGREGPRLTFCGTYELVGVPLPGRVPIRQCSSRCFVGWLGPAWIFAWVLQHSATGASQSAGSSSIPILFRTANLDYPCSHN